jgi:hypothetical protein
MAAWYGSLGLSLRNTSHTLGRFIGEKISRSLENLLTSPLVNALFLLDSYRKGQRENG